mmetsp:Transcript_74049/g.197429  ORF Transcript_74049/g.197429 Transcript_74049/m.197429 type:complete len:246 (+) Transcript_74049:369-1106(+)
MVAAATTPRLSTHAQTPRPATSKTSSGASERKRRRRTTAASPQWSSAWAKTKWARAPRQTSGHAHVATAIAATRTASPGGTSSPHPTTCASADGPAGWAPTRTAAAVPAASSSALQHSSSAGASAEGKSKERQSARLSWVWMEASARWQTNAARRTLASTSLQQRVMHSSAASFQASSSVSFIVSATPRPGSFLVKASWSGSWLAMDDNTAPCRSRTMVSKVTATKHSDELTRAASASSARLSST